MRTLLIGLAIMASCNCHVFSQIDNYDLSTYKYPYIKRHMLNIGGNLSHSYHDYTSEDTIVGLTYNYSDNFNNIGGEANINYNFYLNSDIYQIQSSITSNNTYSNDKRESESDYIRIDKSKISNMNIALNSEHRIYLNGKFYFQPDLKASIEFDNKNYENSIDTTQTVSETTGETIIKSIGVPIAVGYGRIERVEDAAMAVYILKELSEKGVLKREVTNDDVLALAKVISESLNKRVFDSRAKLIYEIEKIDEVIASQGLIEKGNVKYFSTIYDNYLYAFNFTRSSGYRCFFGFTPEYTRTNYNNENNGVEHESNWTNKSLDIYAGIKYTKPLNMQWQFDFSVQPGFQMLNNIDRIKVLYLKSEISLGYYPNTRTYLDFSIEPSIQRSKYTEYNDYTAYNINVSPSVTLNYYLSPQLRLIISERYNYAYDKRKNGTYSERLSKNNGNSFEIKLTYNFM